MRDIEDITDQYEKFDTSGEKVFIVAKYRGKIIYLYADSDTDELHFTDRESGLIKKPDIRYVNVYKSALHKSKNDASCMGSSNHNCIGYIKIDLNEVKRHDDES